MKLITWNIQWGRGVDGRVDLDRIISQAKHLADFDVLCLQEVNAGFAELPGSDGSDQFAEIARRLPQFTAIDGVAVDMPGGDGRRRFGNMILSRFPVMQVFRHLLPWPADPGKLSMQRIALEATLDTPLGCVRVTTTHLEYYSPVQRMAQVERLRELHRDAVAQARHPSAGGPSDGPFVSLPRGGPAILTGDFNSPPASAEYDLLTSPIDAETPAYVDAWAHLHPRQAHAPTVGLHDKVQWPGEPFTFDFVFVSQDLAPKLKTIRIDAETRASDHQPVLIELA